MSLIRIEALVVVDRQSHTDVRLNEFIMAVCQKATARVLILETTIQSSSLISVRTINLLSFLERA